MAATGKHRVRAEAAESVHHHLSWLAAHSQLELTLQGKRKDKKKRTYTCSNARLTDMQSRQGKDKRHHFLL